MPSYDTKMNRAIERRLNAMLRYTSLAEEALRDNACIGMSEAIESANWEGGKAETFIAVQRAQGQRMGFYDDKLKEGKTLLSAATNKFHLRCLRTHR